MRIDVPDGRHLRFYSSANTSTGFVTMNGADLFIKGNGAATVTIKNSGPSIDISAGNQHAGYQRVITSTSSGNVTEEYYQFVATTNSLSSTGIGTLSFSPDSGAFLVKTKVRVFGSPDTIQRYGTLDISASFSKMNGILSIDNIETGYVYRTHDFDAMFEVVDNSTIRMKVLGQSGYRNNWAATVEKYNVIL